METLFYIEMTVAKKSDIGLSYENQAFINDLSQAEKRNYPKL